MRERGPEIPITNNKSLLSWTNCCCSINADISLSICSALSCICWLPPHWTGRWFFFFTVCTYSARHQHRKGVFETQIITSSRSLSCFTKFFFLPLWTENTATKFSRRSDSRLILALRGLAPQLLARFEILPQHTENINLSLQLFFRTRENVGERNERKDHAEEREWKRHLDVSDLLEVLISVPLSPAWPSSGNSTASQLLPDLWK